MKTLVTTLMILAAPAAFAAGNPDLEALKQAEEKCLEQNSSTMGMKMCEAELYQKADAILNSDYKKMVNELKGNKDAVSIETLRRLVAAERAWITFRDANCQYQGSFDLGGTMEGLDILSCLAESTIARVKELRQPFN